MTTTAKLIEAILAAPAERREAILAAASGSLRPRPGTIRQAAAIGECNPRTIQRYVSRGLLTPIRITPRTIRFDLNEVEQLFTQGADSLRQGRS